MKKFEPQLDSTPAVRIGPRVPDDAVGLAYINSPPFTADKIEVLDLSRRIPENVSLQHEVETDMFVDEGRLLRDTQGRSSLPLEEVIVTNEYLQQGERLVPLFWKAVSRHYHYETGIGAGDYLGDKIQLTLGGQPVEEPYRIRLVPTGTPNVYKVEVLCGFKAEPGKEYRLHYHRCDADGQNRAPAHSEILNTVPVFTMVPKEEVLNSPLGAKIYSVSLDLSEGGFQIHVPEESRIVQRTPVWIRWRVHANDGKVSPWFSDLLYHRNSLHPEEIKVNGQTVYIEEGPRAYKILHPNVVSLLGHTSVMDYTVEYKIWDGSGWQDDTNGLVHVRLVPMNTNKLSLLTLHVSPGVLYGYRLEAAVLSPVTGNADLVPAMRGFQSVPVPFELKVSAFEDKPGSAPQVIHRNVAREATATWDLNPSLFPEHSSPQRAVDGLVPLGVMDMLTGALLSLFGKAYAYSREERNPPTNITTLTLDLPQPKSLEKLQIYFGDRGKPEWVKVEYNGNTTTLWDASSIPSPKSVALGEAKRLYEHTFSQPTLVKRIQIGIRPDTWFVRPVYLVIWFIFKFSFFLYNAYKSGFDLVEVEAWEREEIPGFTPWSAENTIRGTTLYQAPFRMSARELMEVLELIPPQGTDLSATRYRVELVNPDHRLNLMVYKNGQLLPISNGVYQFDYADLDQTVIEVSTPDYILKASPRFSVRTEDPGTIHVLPPVEVEADSAWRVRVNNGRIRIRDYAKGYLKEYFLPEFYRQAFDPQPPFRRVYGEEPVFETRTRIRVRHAPLYVETDAAGQPTNLVVRRGNELIPIADWNAATGQIHLARRIEFTDELEVDYTYWVQYVEYGGFEKDGTFYHLDLCPHPGRTYTDLDTKEERPASELLQKDVYLYCLPVYKRPLAMDEPGAQAGGDVTVNLNPLRHLIVPKGTPESQVLQQIRQVDPDALLLGRISVVQPHLPENVQVIDVRRRGGGISVILSDEAALRTYPEASQFWDFGFWDGQPYPSNSILIVTIREEALQNVSEQELRAFLERIVDLGVYPALRFKSS